MRECWKALKNLSYGVYVVSVASGEGKERQYNAMTLRMMTQVSTRPPRVALSIARHRLTHNMICDAGEFAVSVLGEGQELLAGHFGLRSGRNANKLAEVEFFTAQTGAPILQECCAWFECRLEASHDMGNCTLFIAEVINAGSAPDGQFTSIPSPLLFRESDYYG